MDKIRSFIAIELSEDIAAGLARMQDSLKRDDGVLRAVKWVNAHSIHLTLKFLGDVPTTQVAAIAEAMTAAVTPFVPFELAVAGLGCFPNPRRPRVVWSGVHGDIDALQKLQSAVESAVSPLGYPPENRPFRAHLTLGRVRQRADTGAVRRLGELVAAADAEDLGVVSVPGVSLMKSDLRPTGAVYTCLAHAALRGAG